MTRQRQWIAWSQENVKELLSVAHETTILDFKEKYEAGKTHEMAKDIAAFANALGGTILVGAIERNDSGRKTGRATALKNVENPGDVTRMATEAVQQWCAPMIVAESQVLTLSAEEASIALERPGSSGVQLLAINVRPLALAPAGVYAANTDGKRIVDAFRFPVRAIEGTRYLRPEELPYYMNSDERRMLLLLQQVDGERKVRLWQTPEGNSLTGAKEYQLTSIDTERLVVTVEIESPLMDCNHRIAHIPVTFVRAVWRDENGKWNLAVNGKVCRPGSNAFVPPGSW